MSYWTPGSDASEATRLVSRLSKGQHYSDFVPNIGTTTWGVRLSHLLNLQGHAVDHDSGAIQFVCSIR
jgi:hypothetical protein